MSSNLVYCYFRFVMLSAMYAFPSYILLIECNIMLSLFIEALPAYLSSSLDDISWGVAQLWTVGSRPSPKVETNIEVALFLFHWLTFSYINAAVSSLPRSAASTVRWYEQKSSWDPSWRPADTIPRSGHESCLLNNVLPSSGALI